MPSSYNPRAAIIAALKASTKVRDGLWIRGASSHVLADFLNVLEADGWQLRRVEDHGVDAAEHERVRQAAERVWATYLVSSRPMALGETIEALREALDATSERQATAKDGQAFGVRLLPDERERALQSAFQAGFEKGESRHDAGYLSPSVEELDRLFTLWIESGSSDLRPVSSGQVDTTARQTRQVDAALVERLLDAIGDEGYETEAAWHPDYPMERLREAVRGRERVEAEVRAALGREEGDDA